MMHLVILGLLCCTTAEVVPSMRKESKVKTNVMAIKSSGVVEDVSPQKPQMRRVKAHSSASVDSSGGVVSSVQLIAKGSGLGDTGGPVAEALYNAKAELANQITEHEKALSDTNVALTRAEEDKAQKEAALADAIREYTYYINRHKALQVEIANVTNTISTLTSLSVSQQSEIDRLTAAHDAKHNAAKTAEDLEALVVSLTGQIAEKKKVKEQKEAEHAHVLQEKATSCSAAITKFEVAIANLTSRIDDTQAQYDLLTEFHTTLSCSEKETKNERVCTRCTDGEPCGDICITADQQCHHDPGCACKVVASTSTGTIPGTSRSASVQPVTGDADTQSLPPPQEGPPQTPKSSASFLEDKRSIKPSIPTLPPSPHPSIPTLPPSAHPLQKALQDAKAALRKIIAQHQDTIDSLRGGIVENEGQAAEVEKQKNRAIADFEASLKALSDEKLQLEVAHKVSKADKVKAEEDLRLAILKGTAGIDQLAQELKDSITELTAERTQTQNGRTRRVTTCEEERRAMLESQSNTISSLDAEVSQLNQQKSDAQQKLDVLKKQHGVAENADQGTDTSDQGSSDNAGQGDSSDQGASDNGAADSAGAADSQGDASAADSAGADDAGAADSQGDAAASDSAAADGSADSQGAADGAGADSASDSAAADGPGAADSQGDASA